MGEGVQRRRNQNLDRKRRRPAGREFKAPGVAGMTRLNWDLRPTEDVLTKYGGEDPKKLLPSGDYTAELSYGKTKVKQTFHVDIAQGITTR